MGKAYEVQDEMLVGRMPLRVGILLRKMSVWTGGLEKRDLVASFEKYLFRVSC
jgi:hypothetical protein